MKKTMIAALSALMLAGALCAVSDTASINSLPPLAVVGEGSSPFPVLLAATVPNGKSVSSDPQF